MLNSIKTYFGLKRGLLWLRECHLKTNKCQQFLILDSLFFNPAI